MTLATFALVVILGYLIGSIPFGVLATRLMSRIDIRQYGSGKTGAANVLRTAGKKTAAVVLTLDVLKGVMAVTLAGLIVGKSYLFLGSFAFGILVAQSLAALAAITGHIWPVFLGFRGGRGVATFLGGLIALCPPVAIFGTEVLIIGTGLTRYVSLGSIAGVVGSYAILVPLTILNGFPIEYLGYTFIGAVLIIIMHRDNIARLYSGTERRLGESGEKLDSSPVS